ncbi:hypothetical protein O9929_14995 [Vibrio lentus]|nr:hypothetical protein [Vibrio lentus]
MVKTKGITDIMVNGYREVSTGAAQENCKKRPDHFAMAKGLTSQPSATHRQQGWTKKSMNQSISRCSIG